MAHDHALLHILEKVLWVCAVLMILSLFSIPLGSIVYLRQAAPALPGAGVPSLPHGPGSLVLPFGMIPLLWLRHLIWAVIYWTGARVLRTVRQEGASSALPARIRSRLVRLKWFLVASCVLDFALLPSTLARHLTAVDGPALMGALSRASQLVVPNTVGLTSILLALLVHHYLRLMEERGAMREELELTV